MREEVDFISIALAISECSHSIVLNHILPGTSTSMFNYYRTLLMQSKQYTRELFTHHDIHYLASDVCAPS